MCCDVSLFKKFFEIDGIDPSGLSIKWFETLNHGSKSKLIAIVKDVIGLCDIL